MITVLLVASCLSIGFLLLRRERLRTAEKIKSLEHLNQLYVQAAKQLSAYETRTEIGQKLHDDLSSTLAGIVQNMEVLQKQTLDEELRKKIHFLSQEAEKVYDKVRGKSHELFIHQSEYDHLEDNVYRLVDLLCLDSSIHKEIEIEREIASQLDISQRIELLRILQEVLTNTMKHGKDVSEIFIFLYENELGAPVFQVGDNGSSFNGNSDGIGIRSIRKRVAQLGGQLQMETKGGVAYTITLPS